MEDNKAFENLIVMVDCSRNAVRTVDSLKLFMRKISQMGYTGIWLYMEDVYEIPDEPYFGYKRGRYTQAELKEIVAYAKTVGLKCSPAIQTLAHLNGLVRWRRFNPELLDIDDVLMADEPKTYELLEKMFQSLRECFDCEEINVGMDEAFKIGLGRYLQKHGYTDRSSIVVRHLQKVVEIAGRYGFTKPIIWNDMFVRLANKGDYLGARNVKIPDEIMNLIPENLGLACWNYYSFDKEFYLDMLGMQQQFNRTLYYTSGALAWMGVTPMNWYSLKQNEVAIEACKEKGVKNYVVTIWGDDGAECSLFATLPTLAYVAAQWKGAEDYKSHFNAYMGVSFDDYLRLDLPCKVIEPVKPFTFSQAPRYMLFNDCLQGLYDSTITEGDGEKFGEIIAKLEEMENCAEWGYLFKTQAALARTLYYKYELTAKTRKAYLSGDKKALKKIVSKDYKKILKHLDEFYEAFRYQWYRENKPQGFEVQDHRIGGLKQRLLNGKRIIEDYLKGKSESIAELEEPVLSVVCNEEWDGKGIDARTVKEVITANVFSHN